jgi:hypothetical protein
MLYLAAGAVGALVLGVIVARTWLAPSGAPAPAAVTAASTTGAAPPVPHPADATTSSATSSPLTTVGTLADIPVPGPLYSEADLMAFPTGTEERAAVARAEWFVTDYFTADLEPNGSADVRTALPAGADLPDLPQDAAGSLSYVEWARAFRVEDVGIGRYVVGVAFRSLGAPPDRGFYRLPVRAVEVLVEVTAEGGSVVVDLPRPVALPAAPEPAAWPVESGEAPRSVVRSAIAAVGGWGTEPRLIAAQPVDDGWRVVVTVADEVGNRWPVAVRVDGDTPTEGGS